MEHPEELPPSDHVISGSVHRGVLQKLSGRGWLFSGTWKKRFCVLTHAKLYYYEKEHSTGRDKTCGVLNLEYYDVCEEDPKKPFAFVLDSSVKAFFDNRHQFCAESSDEFEGWTSAIRSVIEGARHGRRKRNEAPIVESAPDRLLSTNKDRVRGPQGRRPPKRKSMMPESRSDDLDGRQRSLSLSDPQRTEGTPETLPVTEGKWLSLSLEEVEGRSEGQQRRAGTKGNLLFKHAALTRELEMRLAAHRLPEDEPQRTEETTEEDEVADVLVKVKAALQLAEQANADANHALAEVERMKAETRHALSEAEQAKREYEHLRDRCRELLHTLAPEAAEE